MRTARLFVVLAFFALPLAAASNEFVLNYSASSLQPGSHFEFVVTAKSGYFLSSKAVVRGNMRAYGDSAIHDLQHASNTMQWKFAAPTSGEFPEQSFSFEFPKELDTNRMLFLTVDCTSEVRDREGHYRTNHNVQTLPVYLNAAKKASFILTGEADGAFNLAIR